MVLYGYLEKVHMLMHVCAHTLATATHIDAKRVIETKPVL